MKTPAQGSGSSGTGASGAGASGTGAAGSGASGSSSGTGTSYVIYGIATALIVAAAVLLAQEWVRPTEAIRGAKTGASANQSAPLIVRWGVNDNLVKEGSSIAMWFQFLNQTGSPIDGVGFAEFTVPGFTPEAMCWRNGPTCSANNSPVTWPVTLPAEGTAIVRTNLTGTEAGRYNLSAVYNWRSSTGSEVRDAVTLGPIEVASWSQIVITNLFGRIAGVIVPLSLAVAGLLLQRFQSKYEESRRQTEKQRDDDQRAAEKQRDEERRGDEQRYDAQSRREENERARDAAVLNTLLLQQMHDTKKIYLPLSSKGNKMITDLERWQKTPGNVEIAHEIAYDVAMWWRLQKHMIDQQGGFHLQSRAGEKVIQECWRVIKRDMVDRITRPVLEAANNLPLDLDVTSFNTHRELEPLREAILQWLNDRSQPMTTQLPVLKVLRAVLGFEMNRPFERWYVGEPHVFPAASLRELRKDAPSAIHQYLDVYLNKYATVA
jgi:hypothetical protein